MMNLICSVCGKKYGLNEKIWQCSCGGYLNIEGSNKPIDFKKITERPKNLWRYKEIIPILDEKSIVSFNEGFTPLVKETVFEKEIYLKLDYLFPSGSYKDRGSSVLISKVRELGINEVIEDSSGNAGSSIAMYAAKAKIKANIYVPIETSQAKLVQIRAFGANLHSINSNREDTYNAAIEDAKRKGIYYASHIWNPFFYEGTKTFALEVYEQLNLNIPDTLILPVGNGTLLIGAYKGFRYLMENGYTKNMPRIIGVQAKKCAPIYRELYNKDMLLEDTIAEGIAIKNPLRIKQIIEIIKETRGDIIAVEESEIMNALVLLLRGGFYIEPTSAAVIAALKKYRNMKNEKIVIPLTGNGLKANEKIDKIIEYNSNK